MYLNEIYRHARDEPDSLAVVNSGREVRYRDFAVLIDAIRAFLIETRFEPEGVVINLTSDLYLDWALLLAVRSLGYTTASAHSWQTVEQLQFPKIGALVCFADQAKTVEVAKARPDLSIVSIPRPLSSKLTAGEVPELIRGGRFGDHVLFSSGTTGSYKKVRYSGTTLESCVADPLSGPSARLVSRKDIYHATSFGPWSKAGYIHPLVCWYRGATVVFDQREDAISHFFDYSVTMSTLMPPTLKQLCERFPRLPAGKPKMRMLTGGGFISADLVERAIQQFGCEFHIMYGGTEMRIALESEFQSREDAVWLRPNFDADVEIVNPGGEKVDTAEEGELRIRQSLNYPSEYMDDPSATLQCFRDGYFYPGDMAVRRGDGRIRILGRVSEVLNLGGAKQPVAPLEEWVRSRLQVSEVCLFLQQDDVGREMLIVAIEGGCFPARSRLQAVAKRFAQVPLVNFQLIERFPRDENGMMKIRRSEILRLAREANQPKMPAAVAEAHSSQ